MYSDGITECENPAGDMLDDVGLAKVLSSHRLKGEHSVLNAIIREIREFSGSDKFEDDVSALLLTMP